MTYPLTFSRRYWPALAALLLAGCVESYMPDVTDVPTNYLVVDGAINGNGVTRVKLTRSVGLKGDAVPVEKGAKIFIVDNTGVRYPLTEKTAGSYQSDSLQLSPARQYQLRFTTSTNVAYASDMVPLKVTPPIDKLNGQLNGSQVQLLLDTHDATGQSRYYRWSLAETWEFNSAYISQLEYDPVRKIIMARNTPVHTCWRTEQASAIRQSTTAQLSQDALTNYNLANLDGHDERFVIRYSVLVSQYVETPDEFAYYELLRKNTEAVGGVNDPLPVQLTGNVHRLDNAAEPVLGYVSAHTVQQQRIFLTPQDLRLPAGWSFTTPYDICKEGIEYFRDPTDNRRLVSYPHTITYSSPTSSPIAIVMKPNGIDTLGYSGSTRECVDCRVRGSLTRPSFW